MWTGTTPCGPGRWSASSRPISPRGTRRSSSAPRWARPRPPPSIRFAPSARFAAGTVSGSMWTRRTQAARPCVPSSDGFTTASSWPTATASTRTSGCSPTSTATVSTYVQSITAGLELADSYCFNPHKWLLTNFDCDCFYVSDRAVLIQTLSILPEYLRNQATESGAVFDYRDWGIPMGRRFRALKLWFVIRTYGAEGLRTHIRNGVALAQEFAGWVRADDRFELCAPAPLNLVCFRLKGDDGANERLRDALNASGKMYLIHTKLDGAVVLRLAIGGTYTERRHVEQAWELIQGTAERVA